MQDGRIKKYSCTIRSQGNLDFVHPSVAKGTKMFLNRPLQQPWGYVKSQVFTTNPQ